MLDNYDELMKNQTTSAASTLLAEVDDKISDWTSFSNCLLCKYDRDRYIFVFEEKSLGQMTEGKFQLLDSMREITNHA